MFSIGNGKILDLWREKRGRFGVRGDFRKQKTKKTNRNGSVTLRGTLMCGRVHTDVQIKPSIPLFPWLRCDTSAPYTEAPEGQVHQTGALEHGHTWCLQVCDILWDATAMFPDPVQSQKQCFTLVEHKSPQSKKVTTYPSRDRKRTSTYEPRGKERQRIWLGEEEGRVRARGEDICG